MLSPYALRILYVGAFLRHDSFWTYGLMAYRYYQEKKENLMIAFGALAVLFQPIIKSPLGRVVWNVVDIAVAVVLIIFLLKERESKN